MVSSRCLTPTINGPRTSASSSPSARSSRSPMLRARCTSSTRHPRSGSSRVVVPRSCSPPDGTWRDEEAAHDRRSARREGGLHSCCRNFFGSLKRDGGYNPMHESVSNESDVGFRISDCRSAARSPAGTLAGRNPLMNPFYPFAPCFGGGALAVPSPLPAPLSRIRLSVKSVPLHPVAACRTLNASFCLLE